MAELPACGLYRTTSALPGRETQVPANALIYFHNHSDAGPPLVLLPDAVASNTWKFATKGFLVQAAEFPSTLETLKAEGYYLLGAPLQIADRRVEPGQLIQLGYNRQGEPLAFFPTRDAATNALVFPTKGSKLGPQTFASLQMIDIRGPHAP
ncbi:MAG: hypothetical protein H0V89_04310 [Deltaproteobacteria bacterium]|nr:hypothetical protein [Deltaproteobacteria bacterium]